MLPRIADSLISRRRLLLRLSAAAALAPLISLAACSQQPTVTSSTKTTTIGRASTGTPVSTAAPTGNAGAPQTAATTRSGSKVSLQWWYGWGGTLAAKTLSQAVHLFNAQSDQVVVEAVQVQKIDDKLVTAIAGGVPPQIASNITKTFPQLIVRGSLRALDDYLARGSLKTSDFAEGLFSGATWQGKIYSMPVVEAGPRWGLVCNVDLARQAGLDASKLPTTLSDLYAWHTELTKFDAAKNPLVIGFDPEDGSGGAGPASNVPLYWGGATHGLAVWDAKAMTFHFDDPRYADALATLKKFYDYIGVAKVVAFRHAHPGWTEIPSAAVPSGLEAMIVSGYYTPGQLAQIAPNETFAYGWPPTSDDRKGKKVQAVGSVPNVMPKTAPHPDAGFMFLTFLTKPQATQVIFDGTGFLGGLKAFYDPMQTKLKLSPGQVWYMNAALQADEYWPCDVIPNQDFVLQQKANTINDVLQGKQSPQDAARTFQQLVTADLQQKYPQLRA